MDTILIEKIKKLQIILTQEIESFNINLLKKYPLDQYIKLFDNYPKNQSYDYILPEIKLYIQNIIKISNTKILELYNQFLLLELIKRNLTTLDSEDLPESIKIIYKQNFQRITENIELKTEGEGFYLYDNDKFLKDLAVCTKCLIPAGACKINVDRLSKKFLFKKGIKQFIKGLFYVFFNLGGFKPIYVMHTDSHDPSSIGDYTEEGLTRFFLRVAELLKIKTEIKGICCTGWLNDPKLSEVSPRLAYARRIFTDNGGIIFYIGPSENAVRSALTKSETRRKLYQEGKYIPTDYLAIWSRKKLLKWAENKLSAR